MADALQQLQLDIAAFLTADAGLQYVRVVVARPRAAEDAVMIEQTINEALGGLRKYIARTAGQSDAQWEAACEASGKAGLLIIVMMSEGEVPSPNGPGPALELVQVVRVVENPMINEGTGGTGLTVEEVSALVLGALHQWTNDGRQALYPAKQAMKEVNLANGVGYDVTFKRLMQLQPRAAVARPVITINAGSAGAAESVEFQFTEGVGSAFAAGLYATLYDTAGSVGLWWNNGANTQPSAPHDRWLAVSIDNDDEFTAVLTKTAAALDADAAFSAPAPTTTLIYTLQTSAAVPNADSGNTGAVVVILTPGVDAVPKTMSITCATAAASIYWTSNGTFPSPTSGTLYTSTVNISALSSGTLIRAAAFKSPLRGSDCARAEA